MSSGYGAHGTRGRCNPFWLAFDNCLSKIQDVKDCEFLRDNYIECLHHRKEFARLHALNDARQAEAERVAAGGKPNPALTEAEWKKLAKKQQEDQMNDPKLKELLEKYK